MKGDEARVVAQFFDWLAAEDWSVRAEVDFCDVVAEKDGRLLRAEAKGLTAARGLDIDTTYGHLRRRMLEEGEPRVRYGLVVPDEALSSALRVPGRVRQALALDVYAVSQAGDIVVHRPDGSAD